LSSATRFGHVITNVALAYARADRAIAKGLRLSRATVRAFLSEAASSSERAEIALRIYGRSDTYGPPGLFAWEGSWYERDLPGAPANVLVGGSGSGREMRVLLHSGHRVAGFDPVERLCTSARRELGDRVPIWQLGYEDLSGDSEDMAHRALRSRGPYDAVVCGWASFSHVLDRRARERALQVLDRLCPKGPLMVSFHAWRPSDVTEPPSAFEIGARQFGRRVGALRGLERLVSERDVFLPNAGFIHRFSEEEIVGLARLVEREVLWGIDQRMCGHATLVPKVRR
jgi:protein-L-isoaspartate O-methyltransferase